MGMTLNKLCGCGVILRVNVQQSSNTIFELAGWADPTTEKSEAVSKDRGRLEELFLLRMR